MKVIIEEMTHNWLQVLVKSDSNENIDSFTTRDYQTAIREAKNLETLWIKQQEQK